MKTYVVVSGGFDPIHAGHIEYLKAAKQLGDHLIVGLNSDDWLKRKKGKEFMDFNTRLKIVESIKYVDEVMSFDDSDDSAIQLLYKVKKHITDHNRLIFANGGDRTQENIPEMNAKIHNIEFAFGVGGEKINSSSSIIKNYGLEVSPEDSNKVETRWGYWEMYDKNHQNTVKLKKLVVKPGRCLSFQRHKERKEMWFVASGYGKIITRDDINGDDDYYDVYKLYPFATRYIDANQWHQLINDSVKEDLIVYEIQYGKNCAEDDIERSTGEE